MSATGRWIRARLLAMVATRSHGGRALIRSTRSPLLEALWWCGEGEKLKTYGAGNYTENMAPELGAALFAGGKIPPKKKKKVLQIGRQPGK